MRSSYSNLYTPEVIVPYDPSLPALTAVKGLLLHSSQEGLKELGHFERYAAQLGEAQLGVLSQYLSSEWVPLAVVRTHYAACDQLLLSMPELDAMGRWVAARLQPRLLSGIGGAARAAGYDVWSSLGPIFRFARRVLQGAQGSLVKVGPKDAETTIYGNPLFEYGYYRASYCGMARGLLGLLGARAVHVKVVRLDHVRCEHTVRFSWV